MRSTLLFAASLTALAALTPLPAHACSLVLQPGSPPLPRTPAERIAAVRALVGRATAIVRVRALDSTRLRDGGFAGIVDAVRFQVLNVVAGDPHAVGPTLVLTGFLGARDDFNPDTVPYPYARREAQTGACFALTYRRGAEYLLILTRDERGMLTPYTEVGMPVNEQLRGAADAWVAWVAAARREARPAER